jgi:hypothetical protein
MDAYDTMDELYRALMLVLSIGEQQGLKLDAKAQAQVNKATEWYEIMNSGREYDEQTGQPAVVSEAERVVKPLVSDELFWHIIDSVGWGRTSRNGRGDASTDTTQIRNRIRAKLFFDINYIKAFRSVYDQKIATLTELPVCTDLLCCGYGDNTLNDILAHIVGLGKQEYDAVLAYPKLLIRSRIMADDFVESFAYAIPDDLEEISWSHYVDRAEMALKEYNAAASHPYAVPIHAECSRIADALALLVVKDKEEFLAREIAIRLDLAAIDTFFKRVSLKDLDIENSYAVTNFFKDLKDFGAYLR